MLWEELQLRPWNVQEIIDSALALVPTLPLWAAAAFFGGSMYIVGSVGYAVINAYIQLPQRASAASWGASAHFARLFVDLPERDSLAWWCPGANGDRARGWDDRLIVIDFTGGSS
jgi:hypothetical protein